MSLQVSSYVSLWECEAGRCCFLPLPERRGEEERDGQKEQRGRCHTLVHVGNRWQNDSPALLSCSLFSQLSDFFSFLTS